MDGNKLVRLIYLDESGVSGWEPLVVVAGVIVDGDRQLVALENALDEVIAKHIQSDDHGQFVLHATNIWSGTKYFKNREQWPLAKRLNILSDVVDVICQFRLPIVCGLAEKSSLRDMISQAIIEEKDESLEGERGIDATYHVIAYLACVIEAEIYMNKLDNLEIAMVIAEDRDDVRGHIKDAHMWSQRDSEAAAFYPLEPNPFPFRKIRDAVHFAAKRESKALQVADACAFFIKGYMLGNEKAVPYFERLRPLLLPFVGGYPAELRPLPTLRRA